MTPTRRRKFSLFVLTMFPLLWVANATCLLLAIKTDHVFSAVTNAIPVLLLPISFWAHWYELRKDAQK